MVGRGHLDVLDPRAGPDEVADTLELVTDELARMGRLVEDITMLTRLEDPAALHLETFEADDLIQEVSAKAEPLLDGRLSVEVVDEGRIGADRQRLHQALLGLLSNAVHAGDGATTLRSLRETDSWRFEVADDGSVSGHGSQHPVPTVPARSGVAGHGARSGARRADRPSPRRRGGRGRAVRRRDLLDPDPRMKVLIVEDEAKIASFIVKGLEGVGYETEHVATGAEAIEQAPTPT